MIEVCIIMLRCSTLSLLVACQSNAILPHSFAMLFAVATEFGDLRATLISLVNSEVG